MTSAPTRTRSVRLFQTAPHACGYYPDRQAQDLLLDPWETQLGDAYSMAVAAGFRRSGGQVYRPRCENCRACRPMRLPLGEFRPNRSQRRCWQRNADLELIDEVTQPTAEHFALFKRYLGARHRGGGMDQGDSSDFEAFTCSHFSDTRFLELRHQGQLLAVAVTDVLPDALSAVYTCFDPDQSARALGTLAILRQIDWGRAQGKRFLYLGFLIEGHPKMAYKARFRPAEWLQSEGWRPYRPPAE
ncbi:arginyltransferase [Pseudomarimonas arenosa]|uniref:Aspartate/glutamate leucyltransferase n=1 Tax=Pseudomarimonas arenosa TaxID=2774145 RepID=A0AAW3ZSG0_9GAMM|nr:arginyltransferase [Pseudomarimonas arenosa]MBD8527800.1 arginyltransferase [Pseudomarimonas arenosa]